MSAADAPGCRNLSSACWLSCCLIFRPRGFSGVPLLLVGRFIFIFIFIFIISRGRWRREDQATLAAFGSGPAAAPLARVARGPSLSPGGSGRAALAGLSPPRRLLQLQRRRVVTHRRLQLLRSPEAAPHVHTLDERLRAASSALQYHAVSDDGRLTPKAGARDSVSLVYSTCEKDSSALVIFVFH